MKDFAIIIPVYNEESTIMKVINEVRNCGYDYIVVNDESTDNTSKILVENHIKHINIFPNMGKGYAIREGADYLFWKGFNWVIICDSDGQTPIKDIDKLLKLRKIHLKARIIVGNRLNNPSNMPIIRLYANKLMSWMVSRSTCSSTMVCHPRSTRPSPHPPSATCSATARLILLYQPWQAPCL